MASIYIYLIPQINKTVIIFILGVVFMVFNTEAVFGQSKKQQIDNLQQIVDSLVLKSASDSVIAQQEISSYKSRLSSCELKYYELKDRNQQEVAKYIANNLSLAKDVVVLRDSMTLLKDSIFVMNQLLDQECFSGWYSKSTLNNVIVAYYYCTVDPDGFNEGWNGDNWEDIINTYFIKTDSGLVVSSSLEFCFQNNIIELLQRINAIAKKQFAEDAESIRECGGSLKLPLKFNDLEMHFGPEEVCFEYDVGLDKGNLCGGPRDQVCLPVSDMLKYLK
jgi:hypothetical protein